MAAMLAPVIETFSATASRKSRMLYVLIMDCIGIWLYRESSWTSSIATVFRRVKNRNQVQWEGVMIMDGNVYRRTTMSSSVASS